MCANLHRCSRKVGKGRQYLADNQGNIFDVFGRQRAWAVWRNYHRKPNCHSHYPQVDNIAVSRLVCSAFHGEPKHGQQCHHLNGNIFDNRPDNLIWLSRKEHLLFDTVQRALRMAGRDLTKMSREEIISIAIQYQLVNPQNFSNHEGSCKSSISLLMQLDAAEAPDF